MQNEGGGSHCTSICRSDEIIRLRFFFHGTFFFRPFPETTLTFSSFPTQQQKASGGHLKGELLLRPFLLLSFSQLFYPMYLFFVSTHNISRYPNLTRSIMTRRDFLQPTAAQKKRRAREPAPDSLVSRCG